MELLKFKTLSMCTQLKPQSFFGSKHFKCTQVQTVKLQASKINALQVTKLKLESFLNLVFRTPTFAKLKQQSFKQDQSTLGHKAQIIKLFKFKMLRRYVAQIRKFLKFKTFVPFSKVQKLNA
jgi:hypothetical protein